MNLFQALFLAVVQGITEFLPISSSGHLVLFQKLFGIKEPPILFDVLLHFGTLLAVFVFFRKELVGLVVYWRKNIKLWVFLIVGSVPTALFGVLISNGVSKVFNSLFLVGFCWSLFGLLVLIVDKKSKTIKTREIKNLNLKDGVAIGLFQAAALLPGVSRSGLTIVGGLLRGFSRETAFFLSFILAIPAILGATFLSLKNDGADGLNIIMGAVAAATAGLIGYFSLKILKKLINNDKFYLFGYYCLVLGLSVLFSVIVTK